MNDENVVFAYIESVDSKCMIKWQTINHWFFSDLRLRKRTNSRLSSDRYDKKRGRLLMKCHPSFSPWQTRERAIINIDCPFFSLWNDTRMMKDKELCSINSMFWILSEWSIETKKNMKTTRDLFIQLSCIYKDDNLHYDDLNQYYWWTKQDEEIYFHRFLLIDAAHHHWFAFF